MEERKLAYEAHINRKNAYPEITRIKSLGDINRQLQTSLDSVQMLAVNSSAVEVCVEQPLRPATVFGARERSFGF